MNIRNLDLNLLVLFEALMSERSVSRAARRIGLSQPAMSNALGRLRKTLEDPLLVRRREGMLPTPCAEALIGPVRSALDELRGALEGDLEFTPQECTRSFKILTNDYVEAWIGESLIGPMTLQAPRAKLRTYRQERLFQAPDSAALADRFDLVLGFLPEQPALDAQLRSRELWTEQNVCLLREGHPLLQEPLDLEAYAEARHVAVFYKAEGAGLIDALLAESGLRRKLVVQVPHFFSILPIVANSDLIATVPEGLVRFLHQPGVRIVPVPFAFPAFNLRVIWHERRDRDPAFQWLLHLILHVVQSPLP